MSQQLLSQYQPLAAIATTPIGAKILQPLSEVGATLWIPENLSDVSGKVYQGSLANHLAQIWQSYRAFVFCLATGAVVRLIAPLLQDKTIDPAVVVVDASKSFVINLCGGHRGGGEQLTRLIATQLEATPVLTGASVSLGLPGIDVLGIPYGWRAGSGDWLGVSAAIARKEPIQVIQEAGSTIWQNHLPSGHSFYFGYPEYTAEKKESINPKARIWISATKRQFSNESDIVKVQWHPRVLWVGIGCERGTATDLIETAIEQVCISHHLATEAIAGIATIDIKASELGILELCRKRNLPLKTFCAEQLKTQEVPNPSNVVASEVGTPSVAEASAILAACGELLVTKQIVKIPGQQGAVTVAIALSPLEYTARHGKLYLVGIGPGELQQITSAAKTAIVEADAVIGYKLYLDLIKSLHRPGQIIESSPITQERQRAQRAIELANWGLTVAVVSSGDCGIYGMAGLVLEQLKEMRWDGTSPSIEVFPGISALQSAAALVGAPLMHDFCAISLSDLLTPPEVIEKRLIAAAQADFVTAIYNPRSETRTQLIIKAQEIFLQYRDGNTPVAIVRSAYRTDEQINLTTLEKMLSFPIDMMTTVIIGNSSTFNYANLIITPRGYMGH